MISDHGSYGPVRVCRRQAPQHRLRVKRNGDGWLLWFNDDCAGFDPTKYLQEPAESGQHNEIRMVRSLATEVSYVNVLGLNHLVICVKIAP